MSKAVVLGTSEAVGSNNIGDAIYKNLKDHGWEVVPSHCWDEDARGYRIPNFKYADTQALVVTLGMAQSEPWLQSDFELDVAAVVHASLLLPLAALHQWAQERQQDGTAVVIGSYAHDHVLTHSTAYCAAKAGLAHAVRSLGWELAGHGLFFHIVHPYHVPSTPMGKRVVQSMMANRGMTLKEAEDYQRKDLALPDHLTPTEIAEYVGWLVRAPEAQWMSGQGLNLYGGVR